MISKTMAKVIRATQDNPPMFVLTRDVTPDECDWLERDYLKGTCVFRYTGPTYGCIASWGTACSDDGETPFFELPNDALEPMGEN